MTRVCRRWAALLMASTAACGGTAIIDPPDDDGAGGSATGTGTGTGTTPIDQPCEEACFALGDCVTLSEDCEGNCTATSGPCDSAHVAMLTCYVEQLDASCSGPYPACDDLLFEYLSCRNAGLSGGSCTQTDPLSCACDLTVAGGKLYESECEDDVCDCFANSDYVGTCLQDPSATQLCDPLQTCCTAMLAIAAPS